MLATCCGQKRQSQHSSPDRDRPVKVDYEAPTMVVTISGCERATQPVSNSRRFPDPWPRGKGLDTETAACMWVMLTGMSNYWLTTFHCFSVLFWQGVCSPGEHGRFKSHFSAWGLGMKVLAYLVSLLKSSTQTERDHQERSKVHSFQGV